MQHSQTEEDPQERRRNMQRINIGCGTSPTPGWRNYDNSISVHLARCNTLMRVLRAVGVLRQEQSEFIEFAARADIKWANAARRIPEASNSIEVVYCSHMLEHLDQEDVKRFLAEARRVLQPRGIIRIAVPDLNYHIRNYLTHKDADAFIAGTLLGKVRPKTLTQQVQLLIAGDRLHHWMYDGQSLCRLLEREGFIQATVMPPGATRINEPGRLNLSELAPESVFVEAIRP